MLPLIAAGVTAASNLVSGLMNKSAQEKAQQQSWWNAIAANQQAERDRGLEQNRYDQGRIDAQRINDQIAAQNFQQQRNREEDIRLQKEYATSGIQMRVADARKAGIHPIYALGGSGATYTPSAISLTAPTSSHSGSPPRGGMALPNASAGSMASPVNAMGQDISRALMASSTFAQRDAAFSQTVQEMQLQNFTLRNQLLAAQIQKLKANNNPPMPSGDDYVPQASTFEDRPKLRPWGNSWQTDPSLTNTEDAEKRYGELTDWVVGPYVLWRDYNYNQALNPKTSNPSASWITDFGATHDRMSEMRKYKSSSNWKGHF